MKNVLPDMGKTPPKTPPRQKPGPRPKASMGPVLDPVPGLRQRQRVDGSWRVWWEPTEAQRARGMTNVDLSEVAPGTAARRARALNVEAARKVRTEAKAPEIRPGSVNDLIQQYEASLKFTKRPDSTRESYRPNIKAIAAKWGPQPAALIDDLMMELWYEALFAAKGAFRSSAILRMMSILMSFAEKRKFRPRGTNPCRGLEMVKPPPRQRLGTWAEMDALIAAARALERKGIAAARHIRCGMMLSLHGGQRQHDVWLARPAAFQRVMMPVPGSATPRPIWVWSMTRAKRGNAGQIPIAAAAVPVLRLQLRLAADGPGPLLWDPSTGRAFDRHSIYKRWRQVRDHAALTMPSVATIQWRDLRRTFGHLSRAGGASRDDVADVLGNTADENPELAAVYMGPQLTTTLRAVDAVALSKKGMRR